MRTKVRIRRTSVCNKGSNILGVVLALGIAIPAAAQTSTQPQTPAPDEQKPVAAVGEEGVKPTRGFFSALGHNLGDDVKHIPRKNSLYWLAGGSALALAIHKEDKNFNAHLMSRSSNPFKAGELLGESGTVLAGAVGAYVVGRFTGSRRVQHLGMDEIEALILAEGIVNGGKAAIRRDRPLAPDGTRQAGFSMPSGHATVTFAAATVLQQHLGYRAAIPTYLAASYVAMSRLRDNRHYMSDVVMGAATGIIVGRSVTWHGRNFYGSPLLGPGRAGLAITAPDIF